MKKSCNPNDIHQEGQEQSKKLYRAISESARRLDDAHSCAQSVGELFTPVLQVQRSKFQEYCERLIFADPTLFGRKAEELLWRKTYYDVISAAKKLKKKEYSLEEVCNIETHINAGIGHYHHFISRLQYQFCFELPKFIDFAILRNNLKKSNVIVQKQEQLDWAKLSVHHCLIYLGDLNRYKLEIYPNWDPGLAIRYYLNAVQFNPDYGIPHNQMGTLASTQNRILDAVYHYLCCLSCKYSFDGTENNLLCLFEKNSRILEEFPVENHDADTIIQLEPVDHIKRLTTRFLFLVETWFFNKKISDIYIFCHQTNMDLQECLTYSKPTSRDSEDIPIDTDSIDTDSLTSPAYLTDNMVFKIVVICILCISKLQKSQLHQVSTVVAFTLAVFSQLLQIAAEHIHDSLLSLNLSDDKSTILYNGIENHINHIDKKSKTKFRRRRKKKYSSEEDSDISDVDHLNEIETNSEASGDISIEDLVSSSSDNESVDGIITENIKSEKKKTKNENTNSKIDLQKTDNESPNCKIPFAKSAEKIKDIDPNNLLDIISEEKLLRSLKILCDWFISDIEIVKSCGKSTRSLFKQVVQLLNFFTIDLNHPQLVNLKENITTIKENETKIALPEDISLKAINMAYSSNNFDWEYSQNKSFSSKEEAVTRIIHFLSFGHSLTKVEETGISFDDKKQMFIIESTNNIEINGYDPLYNESALTEGDQESTSLIGNKVSGDDENKGQLTKMKHMGQLWLAAEVHALENRVKSKTSLSPYLVLDADSLIKCTPIVKHLVNSKKFILVIPSAVVSALDDIKREKQEARDAIRWLELQFHHGNRFCRAQRPLERASLPFIKYPKKKDKEMFMYIQIMECCNYFVQQQKNASNLVTLLLGNESLMSNCENREISFTGLALSVGINIEYVVNFYENWRKNFKSKK